MGIVERILNAFAIVLFLLMVLLTISIVGGSIGLSLGQGFVVIFFTVISIIFLLIRALVLWLSNKFDFDISGRTPQQKDKKRESIEKNQNTQYGKGSSKNKEPRLSTQLHDGGSRSARTRQCVICGSDAVTECSYCEGRVCSDHYHLGLKVCTQCAGTGRGKR